MTDVRAALLFNISLSTGAPQMLGKTPLGDRRIVPVTGGIFEGPKLRGSVEPGGSDWILLRPDGAVQLDVRLTLKTEDGALIGMSYRGYRHGPPEVIERLNRGEAVDPSEYYFRTAPLFETSAPRYDWLNRIIAVGLGHRPPGGPVYRVFEVL
ncbi:MAG TPA: DUF3237 domain-containing protein [Stellaceae bacterium]|nr:DUF3237 domain-containing protein [Stellaceae bacterium]